MPEADSRMNGHALLNVAKENRRQKRKMVLLGARIESVFGTNEGVVLDLSTTGAKLRVESRCVERQPVKLVIDRYGPLEAVVVWVRGGTMGLRFTDAPDKIERILGQRAR